MLKRDFLPVRYEPPGDEIVVVRIELVLAEPLLVRELVREGRISQNAGPVGDRPSGQAWQSTVYEHARSTVEIASLEIESAKVAPHSLLQIGRFSTSESLVGTHAAIALIFQRRQHPRQKGRGPCDVVVRKDGDICLDFRDSSNNLTALVGLGNTVNADGGEIQLLDDMLCVLLLGSNSDQDDLVRLGRQDTSNGIPQLAPVAIKGRNYDGNVLRRQPRTIGYRYWSMQAETQQIHGQAKITIEACFVSRASTTRTAPGRWADSQQRYEDMVTGEHDGIKRG